MNTPMTDLLWVAFQRGMGKTSEASGKLNDMATNFDLTTSQQTEVSEVQSFYSLYDGNLTGGLKNVMQLPQATLASLQQNSMQEDGALGVYSKGWLKFAQNELYLPEYVDYQPLANKTNQRNIFEPREVDEFIPVEIYPNPANDFVTVDVGEYETKEVLTVEIVNSAGSVVIQNRIDAGVSQINTSQLTTGVYVIRITDGKEMIQNQVLEIIK
ncbi:MAG: T9SS type A sorting domain-containing protein [Salibacteraceae bacterium]